MINKNEMIDIYNENLGDIYSVSLTQNSFTFEKANEDGEPSVTPIPFEDVKHINNKSEAFKTGLLRFDPDLEEEILKELRIDKVNNKNYFTKEDIEDIILNPDTDKLNRVLAITSAMTIEKFRSILIKLDYESEYDIPMRVFDVINARAHEISQGKSKTAIKLVKKKNEKLSNVELGVVEEGSTNTETTKKTTRNSKKVTE